MTPFSRHPRPIMMSWWQNMADESTERILILLQARDRDLQRAIDKNTREVRRFAQGAAKDTKQMATEIDSHVARVGKTVMGMGRAFAVGLGAGVITAAFSGISTNLVGMVRGIAEVGDQAKRSGLGTKEFQEWQFVAQQNRIGVDSLVDAFKELSLRSDEFIQTGAGPAKESLDRLGISAADLKTKLKDPSALMLEIIGRLEGMSKAAQIRIADELFGGTGGERFVELLAQGEGGLRKTIDRAHEVGAVLDEEMVQKAAEIDRKFQEIGTRISNTFKAGVVGAMDFFTSSASAADILIAKFGTLEEAKKRLGSTAVEAIVDGPASGAADTIYDYEDATRAADAASASLADQARSTMLALLDAAATLDMLGNTADATDLRSLSNDMGQVIAAFTDGVSTAEEFADGLDSVREEAVNVLTPLNNIDGASFGSVIKNLGSLGSALSQVRDIARQAMSAVTALAPIVVTGPADDERGGTTGNFRKAWTGTDNAPKASPRPGRQSVDSFGNWQEAGSSGSGSGKGGGGASRDSFAASVTQIQEQTAALREEAAAFLEVAGSAQQYGDAAEFARTRARLLSEAQKAGKEITPELRAEIDYLAASYTEAGLAAEQAADRLEDMKARAERGVDAVSDIFMAVTKGGDAAKQAVLGLLAEMAKVQFQQSLLRTASSGRGGSLFSIIGGLLGGKRAGGGPVQAGVPYLVNENTPRSEVFVPSSSGAILNVPQAQAAFRGAAGGGAVRVIGGDLTLSDNGTIMARVKVVGQQAAQAGASGAVQQVRANLSSWSKQIQTDGSLV